MSRSGLPSSSRETLRIAPGVYVFPHGSPPPALPAGSLALPVLPSAAFGDGSHATTQLCAQAVDLWCRRRSPRSALDVGTGTGVLARLARARGVRLVVGTDVDAGALVAARANAALDPYPGELVLEDRPPDAWGPRFHLVVANILEDVLLRLADSLVAALAPGGGLLLSGFTRIQTPALRAAFLTRGLAMDLQTERDGWALLQFVGPG